MEQQHYAISAAHDGFRRAGRAWSRAATVVPAAELTAEQLAMLQADPNITVTPCAPEGAPPAPEGGADPVEAALSGMTAADLRGRLIRAAFGELEPGDEEHWTTSGAPEVAALKRITGLASIPAAERDALWAAHQEQRA